MRNVTSKKTPARGGGGVASITNKIFTGQRRDVRRRARTTDTGSVPPIVHEVLRSPGRSLDPEPRRFMESRFGFDFSRVRVHSDERAAQSARAVNASAYTAGRHVVFGAGRYAPHTAEGSRLLAHELTHSIQQGFAANPLPNRIGQAGSMFERQADRAAYGVAGAGVRGSVANTMSISGTAHPGVLQRQEAPVPNPDVPPEKEEIHTRVTNTEHETDCHPKAVVLSWGKDTCCSNHGFPDPDAKRKKGEAACCNTFPKFVDSEAIRQGFDGAASCMPKYIGRVATVTPTDKSKPAVRVACTDSRPVNDNVIELGEQPAMKAYGKRKLTEKATVCYEFNKVPGLCYLETKCKSNPTESQCLPAGCSKSAAGGKTWFRKRRREIESN